MQQIYVNYTQLLNVVYTVNLDNSRSHCAVRSVPVAEVTITPLGPKAHCDTESASASYAITCEVV